MLQTCGRDSYESEHGSMGSYWENINENYAFTDSA